MKPRIRHRLPEIRLPLGKTSEKPNQVVSANGNRTHSRAQLQISREHQRHVEKWINVQAKIKRNKSESYISTKTSRHVQARDIGPPCTCGCLNALGMEKIQRVFRNLWKLGDYDLQNAYISKLVTSVDVNRCRIKNRSTSLSWFCQRDEVEKFKYLGATVTNINDTREEIKHRINMGNACYYSVEKLLSSSLLSNNLKVGIYKTVILPVVLYGCETWTLTLREEHRLRVFENKVLRKIFGAKRDEVTGEWRKLHNIELHALYSSPDIIRNIKSRRLR
ncbi:hypothetical protein ANN_22051 [Periplaneta americana]|uniref:Endonuclease-reverse transcriptase n=1 Tax=Periplaneta americana TaxID=6978 RepID=A0ABQ8S812_PERAM|nr:hypothetical protein ANN_22051 [Periplaneta americana]